jgi:hypothetical protein
MINQTFYLFLSVLLMLGCSQKHKETNSINNSQSSDTISTESSEEEPNYTPLPEIDFTKDSKSRIYLINGRDGFVLYDSVGLDTFRLSSERQRIDVVLQSPTGKYIACLVRVSLVNEPGVWGDTPAPQRGYYDLVVVNTKSIHIVRRMEPPCADFIELDRWMSKSRLLFHTSDGFSVAGTFVFDAYRDSLQRVDDEYGRK